jgi:hypothetical protein
MLISRRTFIRAGTLAALFAGVPLATISVLGQRIRKSPDDNAVDQAAQTHDPLLNYTKATFASYLNSVFVFHGPGVRGDIEVTLMQVSDMTAARGGECFSLLFRGGGGPALRQDTYIVEHAALGIFKLFLVPVGTDDNGAQGYLATINRLSYKAAMTPPPTGKPSGKAEPTAPTAQPQNKPQGTTTPATSPKPIKKKRPETNLFDEPPF